MAELDDDLAALTATVMRTVGVMESGTAFMNGFSKILADAIKSAEDKGATPDQLKAITAANTALSAQADEQAAAIAANAPKPA